MTDITIPREAEEAAAIDLHRAIWGHDCYSWADIDSETRDSFRSHARAACLAMLRSWPGMYECGPVYNYSGKDVEVTAPPSIILPLQEKPSHDR